MIPMTQISSMSVNAAAAAVAPSAALPSVVENIYADR